MTRIFAPRHLLLLATFGTLAASSRVQGQAASSPPSPPPAAAAEATPPPLSDAEVERHVELLLASRSAPEAHPHIVALTFQRPSYRKLAQLLENPKLHAEVSFYLLQAMLRMDDPQVGELAIKQLKSPDVDVRGLAAKALLRQAAPAHTEAIIDAVLAEKDERTRGNLVYSLGRTDPARAVPFLESYLKPELPPNILDGATSALAGLKSRASAPKVIAVLTPELPAENLSRILSSMHAMVGEPELPRLLAMVRDPKEPLRAYAADQIAYAASRSPETPLQTIREALITALDDPGPIVRWRALRTLASVSETVCAFIAERPILQRILAGARDPVPRVRQASIEALHTTVLRRGLITPVRNPPMVDEHTMRMLRWPSDWLTFPVLVGLLDDPAPEVRERAAWTLGIATGYWYGYSDIHLQGPPLLSADAKAGYRDMVASMQSKTPAAFVRSIVDQAVQALQAGEFPARHGSWMRGIRILTGRSFGWKTQNPLEERKKSIADLATWWSTNRERHPAEWLIDSLKEGGIKSFDDDHVHTLARWAQTPMEREVFSPMDRQNNPDEIVRRLLKWWDSVKTEVLSSPSSSL